MLINFLHRADMIMYGDLTIRNYLNDLYDINHKVGARVKLGLGLGLG